MRPSVLLASFDVVPAPKGASAHILATLDALAPAYDVSLVTLGDQPAPGRRHLTTQLDAPSWLDRARGFRRFVEGVLERYRFDVHHARSPWEGLAVPAHAPLIAEINGLGSIELLTRYPGITPDIRQRLRNDELAFLDRADRVVVVSPVTRRYLEDLGVPGDKIRWIPNKPSFAPLAAPPPERAPGGPVRFVYHGTLSPWQGLPSALRVFARLTDLDVALSIYTHRKPPAGLRRLLRRPGLEGRVTLHPPVPHADLAGVLQAHDVALAPLAPSERNLVQGCMPIKILDAMAAGLPVVAPDLPVVRDVVGPALPLYRAWSRADLEAQLRRWAADADLRRRWGTALQAQVRAFSADRQARELRALYGEVVG